MGMKRHGQKDAGREQARNTGSKSNRHFKQKVLYSLKCSEFLLTVPSLLSINPISTLYRSQHSAC